MKAVRFVTGEVALVDVGAPSQENELVDVEVVAAGICGSDLHLGPTGALTVTIGHEIAGRTPDGTFVAIEPIVGCGSCELCAAGRYNLCRHAMATMIGIARDGGMAERVAVSPRSLIVLPDGVRPMDACLIEPLAVTVHGLRLAGVSTADRVGIVGGGTIGLCAGVAAQEHASATVDIETRYDHQLDAAESLGLNPALEGRYDIMVDAAGTPSAIARCVEFLRPGGVLLALSLHYPTLALPFMASMLKEIRVVTSVTYASDGGTRDVDVAAMILARRSEMPESLITHRFPLSEAVDAFRTANERPGSAIKVVISPDRD